MKLIILKDNFKKGLSVLERIVSENSNLPILKNILLKTTDGKIRISATNLEIGIDRFLPGKINEAGGLTVPFSTINNIVANTDSERINLETEKNNLIIKTDNYQARIQGLSQEEFPIIPKIKTQEDNFIEINSAVLKDSLLDVVASAQISDIRPEISGILLVFETTVIKLVATDSFRLSEKTIFDKQFKSGFQKNFKAIIPLKTVQEITRTFGEEETVAIFLDENQILVRDGNQELISRLIDGQYPDYEQIIPKTTETEILLEKEKFARAVRLVGSISGKNSEIKLMSREKLLEVYSSNQNLGENNYLIPAKIEGNNFQGVTFNWKYLLDGLKPIKTEEVFLGVNGEAKPTIVRSEKDASYFYILMPIKAS